MERGREGQQLLPGSTDIATWREVSPDGLFLVEERARNEQFHPWCFTS